ncbi:hypothetical protein B0H14DRAFT_3503033 [Mycena olivaceomarginata]|nr:hypothetical protein B0H14DRAFT_3503033 [Mycena olivaceomarginata]
MANVRPTPIKCHEAAALALAGCVPAALVLVAWRSCAHSPPPLRSLPAAPALAPRRPRARSPPPPCSLPPALVLVTSRLHACSPPPWRSLLAPLRTRCPLPPCSLPAPCALVAGHPLLTSRCPFFAQASIPAPHAPVARRSRALVAHRPAVPACFSHYVRFTVSFPTLGTYRPRTPIFTHM